MRKEFRKNGENDLVKSRKQIELTEQKELNVLRSGHSVFTELQIDLLAFLKRLALGSRNSAAHNCRGRRESASKLSRKLL